MRRKCLWRLNVLPYSKYLIHTFLLFMPPVATTPYIWVWNPELRVPELWGRIIPKSGKGGWFALHKNHGIIIASHHRREEKFTCCFFCNRSNHPFWSLNNLKLTWSNQPPILNTEMTYCLCWPRCAQPGRKPKAPCFKSNPGPSLPAWCWESPAPPFPRVLPKLCGHPLLIASSMKINWTPIKK